MNIIKENIDELNAVLKVKVEPQDYQNGYETAIKTAQRKAVMPGFRPGKVPVGIIKKMYGKSILVEELNKVLSQSVHNYINENKLEVLGNPLPKENAGNHDFDNLKDFEFLYELGLAPAFNAELSKKDKFFYKTVAVDIAVAANSGARQYHRELPNSGPLTDVKGLAIRQLMHKVVASVHLSHDFPSSTTHCSTGFLGFA